MCFTPEDRTQTDLAGCFPISDEDAGRVHVNDCIALRIPNYRESANATTPVDSVRLLDRTCAKSLPHAVTSIGRQVSEQNPDRPTSVPDSAACVGRLSPSPERR
jgi:hypothetical protein